MDTWTHTDLKLLDLMNEQWAKTKNINTYLICKFIQINPNFQQLTCSKGSSNKEGFNLKKSLFERLVNKVMTNKAAHAGKKILAKKLVLKSLEKKAETYKIRPSDLLITLLVKSVPNYTVRRLRFGSGYLTRSTRLTISKKISWFLVQMSKLLKNSRNSSFAKVFENQISQIMANSTKSKILSAKRQCLVSAEKSNIQ